MMSEHLAKVFDSTIKSLEGALKVRLIASFPIEACQAGTPPAEAFTRDDWKGYDCIGVRESHKIVGVLDRLEWESGSDCQRPLTENMLIGANAPLSSAIDRLVDQDFLLVQERKSVSGILTRSDLLKLPVRLFAFAHVTHLELILAKAISQAPGGKRDAWLNLLSPGRRQKLNEKLEHLKQKRLDLSPLELTDFCDKRDVVQEIYDLDGEFQEDLKQIEDFLRNPLAHAATFVPKDDGPARLVNLLRRAKHWSSEVRRLYRG